MKMPLPMRDNPAIKGLPVRTALSLLLFLVVLLFLRAVIVWAGS